MTRIEQLNHMDKNSGICDWGNCHSCALITKKDGWRCELILIKEQTDEPVGKIIKRLILKEYLKKVIGNDKH